ncbi:hypothetical protein B0H14DRAFT_3464830 [Mycena olivaceomarginata]|nr:hypothetical protein B0H14DRAFT_3464830 [Mycena olivaceomarginata]
MSSLRHIPCSPAPPQPTAEPASYLSPTLRWGRSLSIRSSKRRAHAHPSSQTRALAVADVPPAHGLGGALCSSVVAVFRPPKIRMHTCDARGGEVQGCNPSPCTPLRARIVFRKPSVSPRIPICVSLHGYAIFFLLVPPFPHLPFPCAYLPMLHLLSMLRLGPILLHTIVSVANVRARLLIGDGPFQPAHTCDDEGKEAQGFRSSEPARPLLQGLWTAFRGTSAPSASKTSWPPDILSPSKLVPAADAALRPSPPPPSFPLGAACPALILRACSTPVKSHGSLETPRTSSAMCPSPLRPPVLTVGLCMRHEYHVVLARGSRDVDGRDGRDGHETVGGAELVSSRGRIAVQSWGAVLDICARSLLSETPGTSSGARQLSDAAVFRL